MDTQFTETVKRLLFRLEDTRRDMRQLTDKVEYPQNAKLERAYDAIETAEKYLKDLVSK